jgi:hypothetical protein
MHTNSEEARQRIFTSMTLLKSPVKDPTAVAQDAALLEDHQVCDLKQDLRSGMPVLWSYGQPPVLGPMGSPPYSVAVLYYHLVC